MRTLTLTLTLLLATVSIRAAVLDDFENVDDWIAAPSDGVELHIRNDAGRTGRAMRLDFDFHGGAGYAIARKPVKMQLPDDYEFTFFLRGDTAPNTLEFKLLDAGGENVWWVNRRNFTFSRDWTRMRIKKRHLEFAWGPAGAGKPLTEISAIEIVITASTGGKGSVWVDELAFDARPPRPAQYPAVKRTTRAESVTLDFGVAREFGGLTLEWAEGAHARDYEVLVSDDAKTWETVARVTGSSGGRDPLFLPDSDARYVRIRFARGTLNDVRVEPLEFSASRNAFFARIAASARRGAYPRYFENVQSYWTVVGEPGEEREALVSEDGAIEVDRSSFSIEPFVYTNGKLLAWSDVERTQSLAAGYTPIPSVDWHHSDAHLVVTAFARPNVIYARYRVGNPANERRNITLFLAVRPFQVNPPWQFLNVQGGTAEIHDLAYDNASIRADDKRVVSITPPNAFGATTFAAGDITESLLRGTLPDATMARDPFGAASGALRYDFTLEPNTHRDIYLALPHADAAVQSDVESQLAAATREWIDRLGRFTLELPTPQGQQVARVLKSNVAYILINQDGGAIQPGSRSYDRSWIRDGSLTSEALLRIGYVEPVRDFVEWFAPYQFPNGKVPCCVDARGADPVPEHDSHGELIFLIAEYYRHTHDREALARLWPNVKNAVAYIESLTQQRMTPEYQTPEKIAFYGLVPESISHEGYSAKPMHSYWDTLFVLRGLEDATFIAETLGKEERAAFARLRDTFRHNLFASIEETRRMHNIAYIPGSVELGDFDATSTTIALSPVRAEKHLDRNALLATFERYYAESMKRIGNTSWEGYTPYELRTIGSFVRLGWRDRAQQMLSFFLGDLRPREWNQWAEVVFRDPATPKFIGDMPHTWVGSDFIRSLLDMFAYEEDADTLIVGAGVPREWTRGTGVVLRGLRTQRGIVDLTMREVDGNVKVEVVGSARYPNVIVRAP